ncbi:MAG: hypothetical protein M1587_08415, partial [Thaumarchaeota archaeon]|nr:hypothetical protein [Nitrososphaerota archaeon]
ATFIDRAKVASIMAARTILEISGGLLLIVLGQFFPERACPSGDNGELDICLTGGFDLARELDPV